MKRRRKPQFDDTLADALDRHADALLSGSTGRRVRRQFENDSDVDDLFMLAEELADFMAPVEPSPQFVRQLKGNLAGAQADRLALQATRASRRASTIQTILSIFAVTAVVARVLATLVMLIALVINLNKRRRSAAAL